MQRYTVYFIWKLFYMFRVVLPPIIRSAYNCIYSIWYLSHRYCYLPLSVGTGLRVLWVAHATNRTLKPQIRRDPSVFGPDCCRPPLTLLDRSMLTDCGDFS